MAAAMGCSMMLRVGRPGAAGGISVTARFSTSVIADGTQISTRGRLKAGDADTLEQQPDHPLGDVESVIAPPRSGRTATM